ncbi:MAG: UDP-N-acetylmuramoyl-L-alanine--D-glutamate ligase [Tenacibaculum sp.]
MSNLVVLGAGVSGIGTAILGKKQGYQVFVSDKATIANKHKQVLLQHSINFEQQQHTSNLILKADLVVKSPGISGEAKIIKQLNKTQIPVVSEIEFASKYNKATVIGITGSNGKTTTALIAHYLLKKAGFAVGLAGNIGSSFALQVATKNYPLYVLELSSFQLDGIEKFNSHIAILTNITPDHLDRYNNDIHNYTEAKFRITKNQTKKDFFIYDQDNSIIVNWLTKNKIKANRVPFSLKNELEYGAFVKNNKIMIKLNTEEELMDVSSLKLQGKHNTKNSMAAALAAHLLKARKKTIAESLLNFEGVAHRLENILKIEGVQYINDSKATNVNAAYYALECMNSPTVWIAGGVDKGNDYTDLLPLVREKVKAIVCLGLNNKKIIKTFAKVVDIIVETAGVEEAVKVAHKIAQRGYTVLLSPSCASYDLFTDYQDRGNKFKDAVKKLQSQ